MGGGDDGPMTDAVGTPIETDAVVVGAGPVGLFQVFELGLLGLRVQLVDALPVLGGQCAVLYPDKPIYDIPGTPVCSGRELVARLVQQIAPFEVGRHLGHAVDRVTRRDDGRFAVTTAAGIAFDTAAVVIAGGAGAFEPRRLKVDGLAPFEGTQMFHHADRETLVRLVDQDVLVVGDGDAALDAALALSRPGACRQVTLTHRRDDFRAEPATVARVAEARAAGRLAFVAAQPVGIETEGKRLRAMRMTRPDATEQRVPVDAVLVLLGLSPKLGPIADWGLALERKQLVVDTARFETSVPGIFAVGDVVTYPGKRRLIVCGFHEATLAAYAVAERLAPDDGVRLEYTTTSALLQRRLGVAPTGVAAP